MKLPIKGEKLLKYETDVEGFSPALTVLPYSA